MVKRKLKAMAKKKPKVSTKKKLKAQTKKKPKAPAKELNTPTKELKAPAKKLKTPAMAMVGAFTACELSAAKRLVLLSGSNTASSGGSHSTIFSSSGSSVNAPPVMSQAMPYPAKDYLSDEELEDDSQEVPGIPRKKRLYRFIFEIYQVTRPMKK